MTSYTYIAKASPHKTIRGDIEAESAQDVISKLDKLGYCPLSIEVKDFLPAQKNILHFRKVSTKEIVIFTRQLSTLIGSGVNILNGLNIISTQTPNRYLKAAFSDIVNKIKDGKALSESLTTHPHLFSNLYISLVRSGEIGGSLEQTMKHLADFLEKEEELKNSLRAALTYPAFVFSVGALTVIILIGFVIPRLITMFEDMGQVLPLPTRVLIGLSGFFQNYWWLLLAIILISIFLFRRLYRRPQGRMRVDSFKLKLVILGNIILKTEISRLMRTLSLLLHSGISLVYAMDISTPLIGNQILKGELRRIKDQINSGLSFSHSLKESKLFPVFVTSIVTVGEETGNLETSLMRIADDYGDDADLSLKTLTRLLEPIIILVMGLFVGFVVLSMLLPIFQINLIVR